MKIESLQNPKIKLVIKLRKRNVRDEMGLFLIEGFREVSRAIGKVEIESLFLAKDFFLKENEERILKDISKIEPFYCTKEVFEKISYRDRPDGWIAIAKIPFHSLVNRSDKLLKLKNPFFLVAEGIEKPGNLGTIIRSSDGVNVDAIFVSEGRTDIYNPNCVRASVGTLFSKEIIETKNEELIHFLKENKIKIIASSPEAKTLYTDIDFKGPIAVVVGAEQLGLSEFWLKEASEIIKIPMLGIADSLNVATATTILLYEAFRQRT